MAKKLRMRFEDFLASMTVPQPRDDSLKI